MGVSSKASIHEQMNGHVLRFLGELRDTTPNAVVRFTEGDCFQLYLKLKARFPQMYPVAWYDGAAGHVLTKINGVFYDITGVVECSNAYPLSSEPKIELQAAHWAYIDNR